MDSHILCPGCGLLLPARNLRIPDRYNASGECADLYNQLSVHTLSQNDTFFIHQLAVDSYGAQHSGGITKPITTAYALIGLCLAVEHHYTGRQVQKIHTKIPKQQWKKLTPPKQTGTITVAYTLEATTDAERDILIHEWAKSVWESWAEYHYFIRNMTMECIGNFNIFS